MKEDKGRTPLRILLNNFLNHIEKLEAHRSPEDSYEKEFQDLKLFSENLKGLKQYASTEGEKEVNRKKNRYKDILPFDFSRVILSEYAGTAGSDYINANFIKGASGSPAYIASQGPLPHTVNDFWRMVVECEVHVIIMACNQDEAGKHKCEKYWVEHEGEVKQFGMVRIRLLQGSSVCPDFSVRTIKLEYTNKDNVTEERTVCQFHYSAWPDHGVPPSVRPLLDMVRLVRDTQASETLPVLVHCSAGCGRTGTICAIDYVWGLLRAGKLTKDFSLLTLVREMRRQRVAMVQTTEQYVLVHRAVRELFREQLRVIDSHPYENIDLNGSLLHTKGDEEPLYESIHATEEPQSAEKSHKSSDETTVPAPPLPRKNRIHMAASKQEKEVENQTQKQRASQTGPVGIAKLKAMFERSPVSRSQSLGRRRALNPAPSVSNPVKSPPALPIKRSKSLRILGSGERSKLSVATRQEKVALSVSSFVAASPNAVNKSKPPPAKAKGPLVRRRRSFECNDSPKLSRRSLHLDDDGRKLLQDCRDFLAGSLDPSSDNQQRMDNVVAGLGIRERRDSFRQAVTKKTELNTNEGSSGTSSQTGGRLWAPVRNQIDTDEVDGRVNPRQPMKCRTDTDEVDSGQVNVIIVKPDRVSPKPDLYVKSLPGEATLASVRHAALSTAKLSEAPKHSARIWRAATSIDLKSNLRNNDLTLQELKSCLRREGTAHELKLRKDQSQETASSAVKPYKSLDRMPKREDQPTSVSAQFTERRNPITFGNSFNILPSPHCSPQQNASPSPHQSPQTTVDRRNPLNAHSSPHRSPQTTVDRRNPLNASSSPHCSPQTTVDRRNPLTSASSPHHSPQTTVDRRNPLSAHISPHHSPQTTVDRRNPLTASSSPQRSPQTTVDRHNPLSSLSSPHQSPQTTVDRRNPLNQPPSPHRSPQTTVDRRNQLSSSASPHQSPQSSDDRRKPMNPSNAHTSPQATVDRRNPLSTPQSPHRSPQTTVDRRNPMPSVNPSVVSVHPSPLPVVGAPSAGTQSQNSHLVSLASAQLSSSNQPRLPMAVDHRATPVVPTSYHSPQILTNSHRSHPGSTGKAGPGTYDKPPAESYSYGLVASVLRRGSQDDLALCASGGTNLSPKLAPNSQRPSAPPRIKRHASVVLPRKSGGNKGQPISVTSSTHDEQQEQWKNSTSSGSSQVAIGSNTSSPTAPITPSPTTQASAVSTPRSSPKKSAASSLSRALGALQLRRSQTAPAVTSASLSAKNSSKANSSSAAAPNALNSPMALKIPPGSVPPSTVAPTLVITPGKPILPPGIIDDGAIPPQQHTHLLRGPAHFMPGQGSQPPRRHLHPHLSGHTPLSHQLHQHRHPFPSHASPPRLPIQHRHPSLPQHFTSSSPQQPPIVHHVYPQHPVQHPKTHKKQQYL